MEFPSFFLPSRQRAFAHKRLRVSVMAQVRVCFVSVKATRASQRKRVSKQLSLGN